MATSYLYSTLQAKCVNLPKKQQYNTAVFLSRWSKKLQDNNMYNVWQWVSTISNAWDSVSLHQQKRLCLKYRNYLSIWVHCKACSQLIPFNVNTESYPSVLHVEKLQNCWPYETINSSISFRFFLFLLWLSSFMRGDLQFTIGAGMYS
jgi:hypothetical protein